MIDGDGSGTLEKEEILRAVRADQKVIAFLTNCGNKPRGTQTSGAVKVQFFLVRSVKRACS